MKSFSLIAILAASPLAIAADPATDCRLVSSSLKNAVVGKPIESVLEMLSREVKATPQCSCELIKSAIKGYKPRPQVVAVMVDTAIQAAPEHMDVIIRCAAAAAPDALEEILGVASQYGKVPNPLDSPITPDHGPNGQFFYGLNGPLFVNPPQITLVDP